MSEPALPPDDAEDWSDEEWIEYLESTEQPAAAPIAPSPRRPKSIGAQFLGAAMLGMHEIFYGRRQEKQVEVAPAPGPPDDEEFELDLDPDDPSASEVRFRDH